MNFTEQLNDYIKQIGCSSKELANASTLSPTVISRYRNGERLPSTKNLQLKKLTDGLVKLAEEKNIPDFSNEIIFSSLAKSLNYNLIDLEEFRKKFNEIITVLSINIADLAKNLNFDDSYISKIRTGKRTPANIDDFIDTLCKYISSRYNTDDEINAISLLISCSKNDIQKKSNCLLKLKEWFFLKTEKSNTNINIFLKKLDDFNLNEYIKVIHFDEIKVPSVPFYKHSAKTYYGLEQMKQGELDFFKATVLSKSNEPVYMYSDMPLDDMAKDTEFSKKWMFAIAMTLKKGLHLNIIHNINRPFNELLLGLEGWIPIYMTGQISPYYLKGIQNSIFCHFNYASGKVALAGECINGFHNDGKYYLTSKAVEVAHYNSKAKNLISKATPLMEIYRKENKNTFYSFILTNSKMNIPRRRLLSSLPLHTISEDLFLKILKRNKVSENNINELLIYLKNLKNVFTTMLSNNTITDELLEISKTNFKKETQSLLLSESFFEDTVFYNYEEYKEHLEQTKKFEQDNTNYHLKIDKQNAFKNIQITIQEGKNIIISKNTDPAIHFVISHQKLREAIENFIPPITD